jgi:hypothetical protein
LKNLPVKKAAKNDRHSNGALVLAENKELMDLATDLVAKASGLAARLSPALRSSVGDLVRSMNCYYYSNLIEYHNTTLIDLSRGERRFRQRSLTNVTSNLEAKAPIESRR